MQNTPPGAWSFRGAPVVFPVEESDTFLSALLPQGDEDWIYTRGISGALDFLQMPFDDLLDKLKQTLPLLNDKTIESKSKLDQTIAEWMLPLLPAEKQDLWNSPSILVATTHTRTSATGTFFWKRRQFHYPLLLA